LLIREMLRDTLSMALPAAGPDRLVLRFGGTRVATADWSPGGVRLDRPAARRLAPDSPVAGEIEGFGVAGPFEGHISHADESGAFLRFDSVPTPLFLEMLRQRGA